jgi:O-antigen/teichoic acid export membrane protein
MSADQPESPPAERSLTHRTVGSMAWVAWGSGALAVLKILGLVLLTRLLSPADFGVVSAALVVISFSLNFSQLGLGPAVVQRPVLEPRHLSTAFIASLGLGLLVAAIVWISAPAIAQFFRMEQLVPVVRWLALVFPLAGIATVPESLLQRELRFRVLANRDVVAYGLGYGVIGILLAFAGWGVWALVIAQLAQAVIRTGILLGAAPPFLKAWPTWTSFRELMSYGIGQSISRIGVILANQADNIVVGRWLGAVALGYYSRAYQLMAVPTSLLGDILDKVLFPTMARVQDDTRRLGQAYVQGTALLALITLPVGVVAALLAPDLIMVVFGSRWERLVEPFQILVLGITFRTGYRVSDSLSRATGQVYRRAWRQGVFAGLVFLGALIGQQWGLSGVAFGVLAAFLINYLSMAQLSLDIVQISWRRFLGAQLPAVRLAILVGAVTLAITLATRHLAAPPIVGLAVGAAGAMATTGLAVWLLPAFALGEQGLRSRETLRTYLMGRLHPVDARGSP